MTPAIEGRGQSVVSNRAQPGLMVLADARYAARC